jgi:hypothetical protein
VVFSGHQHKSTTRWQNGFWELNTGSLEESPQFARLIDLRRRPDGRLILVSRVLRRRGVPADLEGMSEADLSARLTACAALARREVPLRPPTPGGERFYERLSESTPAILRDSSACGAYGAERDRRLLKHRRQPWQAADAARREGNVVLDVSTQR